MSPWRDDWYQTFPTEAKMSPSPSELARRDDEELYDDSRDDTRYDGEFVPDEPLRSTIPTEAAVRKSRPICTGVFDYFPDALLAVAEVSRMGNDQHNPGQPLHWDKSKSTDHADSLMRHMLDRGTLDSDGGRHSAKVAWRALALLQTEIEAERAQPAIPREIVPPFRITVKLPIRDTNGDVYDVRESTVEREVRDQAHGEAMASDLAENIYLGRVVTLWSRQGDMLLPSKRFHFVAVPEAKLAEEQPA